MRKYVTVVLVTLCTIILIFRGYLDIKVLSRGTNRLETENEKNAVQMHRLQEMVVVTEQDWLQKIELTSRLYHQRLSLQHKIHNLPFRYVNENQSLCIVSMHEYPKEPMKSLLHNLTQHKREFSLLHRNMGYIDIDASSYRQRYANLSSTWLKLPALRDILANDTELKHAWYMWVDADIVFTNNNCTFQELLSTNHRAIFVGDFNSGVFLIRNHPWSIQFLDAWFATWPVLQHSLGQEDEAYATLLLEDKFVQYIYALGTDRFSSIVSYPSPIEQAFSWHPGHCMLHAAGFWQHKASILYACLQSEYACVSALNKVYAALNGTARQPLTAQLDHYGYGRHVRRRN